MITRIGKTPVPAGSGGLPGGTAAATTAALCAPLATSVRPVAPAPPPGAGPPRADCTADRAGGVTFDVRLTGGAATAAAAVAPRNGAALLLRRRGGEGPADTVRLPLGPAGEGPVLRAVLPSITPLPEGRWDAFLAVCGAEPQRLRSGVHDLRSLVDRVPRPGRTWLGVRIPYATKYGNLTLRSWLRWPHAEAGRLCVTDGVLRLQGVLYGARLEGCARIEARPRAATGTGPVRLPVGAGADVRGAAGSAGCRQPGADGGGEEGRFTAELPLTALSDNPVWDLWLRPGEHAEAVRIARILDDVPDKRNIFRYPPQTVRHGEGTRSVRPYYTLDNDLSVRVANTDE